MGAQPKPTPPTDGSAAPREQAAPFWAVFTRSANPMMLADNERRYVEANDAAIAMLGYSREELLALRIEDLTPPEHRGVVDAVWSGFLAEGSAAGHYPLLCADGRVVTVEYNATAYILPGLHLTIFLQLPEESDETEQADTEPGDFVLTPREREVLGRVAMGESSAEIAEALFISPETVRQHVQNALQKLGARTRAQAIGIALRTGQLS
jgi:PAS domain S-box-containing protein